MSETSVSQRLAGRLGWTDGQLQTAVLGVALATLVTLLGLPPALGRSPFTGTAAAAPRTHTTPGPSAPVVVPTAGALPLGPSLPGFDLPGQPVASQDPVVDPAAPTLTPDPGRSGDTPEPTTSPTLDPTTPCDAQAAQDAGATVITTLATASGGVVPQDSLLAALGTATGCDPSDPAIVALGLIVSIGGTLPDPGLPGLPPLVPPVTIPPALVQAVQPARAQIDTLCGTIATVSYLTNLGLSSYPNPIPATSSQVLFQALFACGQLRP